MLSIKNLEEFIQEISLPDEQMIQDKSKTEHLNFSDFANSECNMEYLVSFLELNSSVKNVDYDDEFCKKFEIESMYHSNFFTIQNENKVLKNSNKKIIPVIKNGISHTTSTTDLKFKGDSQTNSIYTENISINDDLHFGSVNKTVTKKRNSSENFENEIERSIFKNSDIVFSANNTKHKHSFINKSCQRRSIKPYTHIKKNHIGDETKVFKIKSLCKKNNFHQSKINDEKENLKNNYEKIKLSDNIIEEKTFNVENKSSVQKIENFDNLLTTALIAVENNSHDDPIVIDSDSSNDEPLILPSCLTGCSLDDRNSSKMIPEANATNHIVSGDLSKCTLTLDRIIDAKKEVTKEGELISNVSKNEIIDNKYEDTDLQQLLNNINMKEIQKDRITDLPPGLNVFDYKKCYRYFCVFHGLNLENCGFQGNKGTAFDRKVAKLSIAEVKELITFGIFQCQLNSMSCKEPFLEYCFKLLSVLNDNLMSYACKQIFWYYIKTFIISKKGHLSWCPQMKDVLTIILNYGVNIFIILLE